MKAKVIFIATMILFGSSIANAQSRGGPVICQDAQPDQVCQPRGRIPVSNNGIPSQIEDIRKDIVRLDKEDMRVKSGEVNGDTLTLRVEDYSKSQGRSEPYGKDVNIDVSSLRGSKGDKGDQGLQGIQGVAGKDGKQGPKGDKGEQGIQGVAGLNGVDGKDGIDGKDGEQGIQGEKGDKGDKGEKGDTGFFDEESQQVVNNNTLNTQKNSETLSKYMSEVDVLRSEMNLLDRNLSAGVASAIAMGQHHFDPTYTGGQVSISGGYFNGQNAVSLAFGMPVGSNAFFSISGAANSGPGNESIGAGITIRLP